MFVGIVYQGVVLSQHVVSAGQDRQEIQSQADAEAHRLNAKVVGYDESYTAGVLEVPDPLGSDLGTVDA